MVPRAATGCGSSVWTSPWSCIPGACPTLDAVTSAPDGGPISSQPPTTRQKRTFTPNLMMHKYASRDDYLSGQAGLLSGRPAPITARRPADLYAQRSGTAHAWSRAYVVGLGVSAAAGQFRCRLPLPGSAAFGAWAARRSLKGLAGVRLLRPGVPVPCVCGRGSGSRTGCRRRCRAG